MERIFISYAREDEAFARALAEHLDQLRSMGRAETWFDRDLSLGDSWEERLHEEVAAASVVLVLVSHQYLAGGFVLEKELPLIERAAERGASVIPVIVGDCAWRSHGFIGSLNAFNSGNRLEAPTTKTFGRQAATLVDALAALGTSAPDGPEKAEPKAIRPEQPKPRATRTDAAGLAFKGSQLQTQLYVNAATDVLDDAVREAVPALQGLEISWRSPLRDERYAEYRDAEFLNALGLDELTPELKRFWPARGPRWDALARAGGEDSPIAILVEGKSYPAEMVSTSEAAGHSREQIAGSIVWAQQRLGMEADPERWLSQRYQLANRLAHTLWLRDQGVEAWLLHILFVNDPHSPTDEAEWLSSMGRAHKELGASEGVEAPMRWVCLPALTRVGLE